MICICGFWDEETYLPLEINKECPVHGDNKVNGMKEGSSKFRNVKVFYYVQRYSTTKKIWGYCSFGQDTIDDARKIAEQMELGSEDPEVLKIVDGNETLCAWVPRNNWNPEDASTKDDWTTEDPNTPKFAMGALAPPELAWQEGLTAGMIATINTLLRAEAELKKCLFVFSDKRILTDIDELLKWLGVRK
jgi:hypothetical protein